MISRLLRAIRCRLDACPGRVVSGWRSDGLLMNAWRCDDCGEIRHVAASFTGTRISPTSVATLREMGRKHDGAFYWEPPEADGPNQAVAPGHNGGSEQDG